MGFEGWIGVFPRQEGRWVLQATDLLGLDPGGHIRQVCPTACVTKGLGPPHCPIIPAPHSLGCAPGSSLYTWPGATMLQGHPVGCAGDGVPVAGPLPLWSSGMPHSWAPIWCFPLPCKLANIMAQLGSQLKEFQPIKRKYCAI